MYYVSENLFYLYVCVNVYIHQFFNLVMRSFLHFVVRESLWVFFTILWMFWVSNVIPRNEWYILFVYQKQYMFCYDVENVIEVRKSDYENKKWYLTWCVCIYMVTKQVPFLQNVYITGGRVVVSYHISYRQYWNICQILDWILCSLISWFSNHFDKMIYENICKLVY